jgi:hypothetical protein
MELKSVQYATTLITLITLMSIQSRKHRGYRTQKVVAEYLKQFYPYAEPTGAGRQGSDILGTPFDVEVKAVTKFSPKAWINQIKERKSDKLGFVVLRCNGQGEKAGDYVVLLPLSEFMKVLNG